MMLASGYLSVTTFPKMQQGKTLGHGLDCKYTGAGDKHYKDLESLSNKLEKWQVLEF